MHLVIRKEDLARAVGAVAKVVEARNTIPILSNILLDAGDGYAHAGDYLEMDCLECHKPSAVRFGGQGGVTLIAARTHADEMLAGV